MAHRERGPGTLWNDGVPALSPQRELRPRLCTMKRGPNGYGFNLHSDKSKPGQFIRSVDPDSPAEASGLRAQDRIVEVGLLACVPGSPLLTPHPHRYSQLLGQPAHRTAPHRTAGSSVSPDAEMPEGEVVGGREGRKGGKVMHGQRE